ncbi:hypothetical protein Q3O60_09135 [Alkalimonas collagenimarina]|uniref:Uncharacterized protein n=1 Tax=Alkalimonas collagenimarina TaxID=400390 RepID=A0ABT9GZ83_9GAMM|nr:hypothetical protein [Alkalimonas collagenimarina]MDP4536352.1 hypothetical protein [Alkalimonas collagenimarina]
MIQTQPLVSSSQTVTPEVASNAEQLATRLRRAYHQTEFQITSDEANALIAIGRRIYPEVQGRVNIANHQMIVAMSAPLFQQRLYLNVSALVLPSKQGLKLDEVRIGRLRLPGWLVLSSAERIGNQLLKPAGATQLRAAIHEVTFEHDTLILHYQVPEQLQLSQLNRFREQWQPYGDPEHIQHYYQTLVNSQSGGTALSGYLEVLFKEASRRYQDNNGSRSAIEENQAALLALAVFFGSSKLELILGDVRTKQPVAQSRQRVTLAGRLDLQQHFVYSAAIKTLTNRDIGFLAGEMKELLDTNPGGSGFSFVDLLADKAGVRFAEIALYSEATARALQQFIVQNGLTDAELLPDFSLFPEGIQYDTFREDFDTIESEQYQLMLAQINQALAELPLYQLDYR